MARVVLLAAGGERGRGQGTTADQQAADADDHDPPRD